MTSLSSNTKAGGSLLRVALITGILSVTLMFLWGYRPFVRWPSLFGRPRARVSTTPAASPPAGRGFPDTPAAFSNEAVARAIAQWKQAQGAVSEKPENLMTPEEVTVKRKLEKQVRAGVPTHRIVFDGTQTLKGWVLEDTQDYVRFSESYGSSGSMSLKIARRRINSLEALPAPNVQITYRDVRFQMEFPNLSFYRRAPYTIMTDESFFKVESTVRCLEVLYGGFVAEFRTVIPAEKPSRQDYQVLFFRNENAFRAYQGRYAPGLEGCVGFYSPEIDRLVVFNEMSAAWARNSMASVNREVERHRAEAEKSGASSRLSQWQSGTQNEIAWQARTATLRTIRHEGAHQLSYDLGVLSVGVVPQCWLSEGLATYCEPEQIGARNVDRTDAVKALARGGKIPIEDILNIRRMDLAAYGKCWALMQFLVQSPLRNRFYEYLRYQQQPAGAAEIEQKGQLTVLCRFLGMKPEELTQRWESYLSRL